MTYQFERGVNKCLPPEDLCMLVCKSVGLENGTMVFSVGRGSALENAAKVVSSLTRRGVVFFQGFYYGSSCIGLQVGGREMVFSCDNFEVLNMENILTLEKKLEKCSITMGGAVVQPYDMNGKKVNDTFLKILRASCNENFMLVIDDETMSPSSEWRNVDVPVDIVLLGDKIVFGMLAIEVMVVRNGLEYKFGQELLHPEIYNIVRDRFGGKE